MKLLLVWLRDFWHPTEPVQVEPDPLQATLEGLTAAETAFSEATDPADVDRAILVENTYRADVNNHIRRQRIAQGLPVTNPTQFQLPWLKTKKGAE
jgi:hypothetical protein